jgi:AcrR family transcriptional regulator
MSLKLTVTTDTECHQVILRLTADPNGGPAMPSKIQGPHATDPMSGAIAVFSRQGYDATTVDDLAEAVELSRSTFFRRYGSKEDVVFADHELLLKRVEESLKTSRLGPLPSVAAAARMVFDHHVERREVSLARFALLHDVAALRDRELITVHRYERAFASHLRATLTADDQRDYVSIAFSAAVVAVHNAVLREWLFDPQAVLGPRLDAQLRALVRAFGPDRQTHPGSRVVVTVIEPGADADAVLESIRSVL